VTGLSADGCSSLCTTEVLRFRDVTPTPIDARSQVAMAYDPIREVVVLFGGLAPAGGRDDTWAWNGVWRRQTTARVPPRRIDAAMVFDQSVNRILMFGNVAGDAADTWEWDGSTWSERSVANPPPPRAQPGLAYDAARGRVVLFGGTVLTTALNDTWEWNGSAGTWTQLQPATSPPPMIGPQLAYDSARGETVLYGTQVGTSDRQTWTWNGTNWTRETPATSPTPFTGDSIAYDPVNQRVIMFGAGTPGTTWAWNGTTWSALANATGLDNRFGTAMAFDQTFATTGVMVLFGGREQSPGGLKSDTWTLEPVDNNPANDHWVSQPTTTAGLSPTPRGGHAMVYDARRGETLLYGGAVPVTGSNPPSPLGDTWTWRAGQWTQHGLGTSGPLRAYPSLAYDAGRGVVGLFGGGERATFPIARIMTYHDTLEGNGPTWTSITPAVAPSPRFLAAATYDAKRGEVVLFGGARGNEANTLADTWTYNGTTWTLRTPATSPPARAGAAIAYDPIRERVVLYGGAVAISGAAGRHADTWEWDGTTWTQIVPPTSPGPRHVASMVFDPDRGRIVLLNGFGEGSTRPDDIWEWDGATWTLRAPDGDFPGGLVSFAYHAADHQYLAFSGFDFIGSASEKTWVLESRAPTADHETCIVGTFDDDGDGLAGCADPDCWPVCTPLCPPTTTCAPTAPRCGDAVCAPVETEALCPSDC